MSTINDPYQLRPEDVIEPPKTFIDTLKRIGPGMILAASIVGSGELIATTTLGAKVGYTAMWIIILSCLIKPIVQAELGRYVIASGETGLAGFNRVPGPRAKVNWIVWAWAAMTLMTMMQVGAMFGGVSQVMHLLIPSVSAKLWVVIFLAAALLLIQMPQYFSWEAFWGGFKFKMPGEGFADAVAVFGITGVGASELFMYPYWCVEKGYARFAGRRDGSANWQYRARGWVRVMHTDIVASMIIYTVATVAFYLLGAGVLNGMKLVPKEGDMILTLSNIYTQTLGPWSRWLFYAGAIVTLYGTIFAATAANSRVFSDMLRLMGAFSADDAAARARYRNLFIVLLTVVPVGLIFIFTDPVHMVKIGGIAQAMMLPVIGAGAVYLRHHHLPKDIQPSQWVTVGLWVATALIVWLMGYSVIEAVRKMQ